MNLHPPLLDEFSIINTYFKNRTIARQDVLLGIGDDAAIVSAKESSSLVMAIDTFVENIHFLSSTRPEDIGYKALAVNLSDLAAMGAQPMWAMLALTMPTANQEWVEKFSKGLFELANQFNVQLIGGDTTRGPLSISIQVTGSLSTNEAPLSRHGAKIGDKIYVSGTLGDAGLGLQIAKGENKNLSDADKQYVLQRLHRPTPRVPLGRLLQGKANAVIDISDGLLVDVNHLITASGVGALIDTNQLPLSIALQNNLPKNEAKKLALTAGDDYELCFTVSPTQEERLLAELNKENMPVYCIGEVISEQGIQLTYFSDKLALNECFKHW